MKESFVIVGYYTLNTLYEKYVRVFLDSLIKFKIPYHIEAIESLGCWFANINYKPTFIKRMMEKFPERNIVYVDCDAEFLAYPDLFERLDCNISVHLFDRACYKRRGVEGYEILSGTIFLRNNKEVFDLVNKWEKECQAHPFVFDQISFAKILGDNYHNLPEEYCTISGTMKHVKYPVIMHHQASREVKKNKGKLRMTKVR